MPDEISEVVSVGFETENKTTIAVNGAWDGPAQIPSYLLLKKLVFGKAKCLVVQ